LALNPVAPRRGYEPTREASMAAFAKSWRREQAARVWSTDATLRAMTD
jgi:hypothetical protein